MGLVPGIKALGNRPVGSAIKEDLTDKQKQLDVDKDDEIEGSDCVDLGLEQNEEAFYNAIRGITLAYYDMDDKQILTNAKILGKLVTDKLTKLVEKDL